jgi:AbrB family looped-hinge helix DNA binding protein
MKYTTFMTEVKADNIINLPIEVREKMDLHSGDKIEITIRKIKSRRLEILISENPLYKLINFTEE